jgi:hypothetical protein
MAEALVHLDREVVVQVVVAHMEYRKWASSQWRTEADLRSKRDQLKPPLSQ